MSLSLKDVRGQLKIALILLSGLFSGAALSASFDCSKAKAPDEKAICSSRILSEKDVRMATTYSLLQKVMLMGARGQLHDEQLAWMKTRQQCGSDTACLSRAYDNRIGELNELFLKMSSSIN